MEYKYWEDLGHIYKCERDGGNNYWICYIYDKQGNLTKKTFVREFDFDKFDIATDHHSVILISSIIEYYRKKKKYYQAIVKQLNANIKRYKNYVNGKD